MTEAWRLTATEAAAAVRDKKVSASEITKAHIARMQAVNPALNAVVVDLSQQALRDAAAADQALARGLPTGKLHGVPVTVKINIDLAGQANSNGVEALRGNIARDDSPVVSNLKKAGAIILGMTNTPEFSMRAFTDNTLHGATRNPWSDAITCGGSSGGAGAAIAAGIGTIAHGNDIGGSLRWPAFCNGIATIKPTQGRIPANNPSAAAERPMISHFFSSQGPLARCVADVRLGLEVMSQRDMRDPWWVPAPLLPQGTAGTVRVARARIPAGQKTDARVVALLDQAADYLREAGYEITEAAPPDIDEAWRLWCDLLMTDMAFLRPAMHAQGSAAYGEYIDRVIAMGNVLTGDDYMRALAARTTLIRRWCLFLEDYPLILAPASTELPPAPNADLASPEAAEHVFRHTLRFIAPFNMLGLPAASAPMAVIEGAPAGVQLIATRFREDICLDAAAVIEARVGMLVERLWA